MELRCSTVFASIHVVALWCDQLDQGWVILEDCGHNNPFGWLLYIFHAKFLQNQALVLYFYLLN